MRLLNHLKESGKGYGGGVRTMKTLGVGTRLVSKLSVIIL